MFRVFRSCLPQCDMEKLPKSTAYNSNSVLITERRHTSDLREIAFEPFMPVFHNRNIMFTSFLEVILH